MGNPFVHVELATTDVAQARSFYQSLFDWTLKDEDMGGGMTYAMIGVGEGTGGGMMKHPMPDEGSTWLPYVLVEDVAAATAKAKLLGAKIVKDVTEVMGAGSFSIISDPTGAVLGAVAAQVQVTAARRSHRMRGDETARQQAYLSSQNMSCRTTS
jgi:predicted enzyme related to lactoylglutathione lyase